MEKETVIILGGGIAGLITANELADHYHIILIEADNRLGGRIHSYKEKIFSTVVEGGSEFIHGKLKETLNLLKQADIDYTRVKGEMYRKEKAEWIKRDDIMEGWDELLKKMKKIKNDMTMYDFLQQYFNTPEKSNLRRHVIAFTEGFDVADIKKVSVKSLYKEWSHETFDTYRITGGYGLLINWLVNKCEERGCRIITGEAVKQIDWETNSVTVYTASEKKFNAEKVVVTVPISVLQKTLGKASVNFTPPLDDYINAAQQIGYGDVIKVLLQFKESLWKKDTGFILSDEMIPTWWTQLPDPIPLLTGWAGGSKAQRLSDETDDDILEKALLSLANIFNLPVNDIREKISGAKVFNWQKNEWSLGAYSYFMPESVAAIKLLNTPVNNTIYFSGEALYEGESPGTVEAAIVHAKQTAAKLLKEK